MPSQEELAQLYFLTSTTLYQNYLCINYLILLVCDNLINYILVIMLSLLNEIKKIKFTKLSFHNKCENCLFYL